MVYENKMSLFRIQRVVSIALSDENVHQKVHVIKCMCTITPYSSILKVHTNNLYLTPANKMFVKHKFSLLANKKKEEARPKGKIFWSKNIGPIRENIQKYNALSLAVQKF